MMNVTGLNYGQLIKQVELLKPETIIRFDFGYMAPFGFHSYRGYYCDLAIGFTDEAYPDLTSGKWLEELKAMNGQHLEGYKGGGGIVTPSTSVWVSKDYSQCTGTVITGINDLGYGYAIINTAYED